MAELPAFQREISTLIRARYPLLYLVSWLLIFTVIGAIVGIPLIIALFLVSAWCHIKGAVRAADDRPYDYPFQIRVLS